MTTPERYTKLQTAAQEADRKVQDLTIALNVRYSDYHYASRGQLKQLAKLRASADKHQAKFFAFLATLSPRAWDSGIPVCWIRDVLTYDDAVTVGQLSVIPPPAWGFYAQDSKRFAEALR